MTLTPQNMEPNIADIMSGATLKQFHSAMQNFMQISEVHRGSYKVALIPAKTGTTELYEDYLTGFKFKPKKSHAISIDNSYNTMNQRLPIEIPKQANRTGAGTGADPFKYQKISYVTKYLVGYENYAAIMKNLRFIVDNQEVLVVTRACYDWFLQYVSR